MLISRRPAGLSRRGRDQPIPGNSDISPFAIPSSRAMTICPTVGERRGPLDEIHALHGGCVVVQEPHPEEVQLGASGLWAGALEKRNSKSVYEIPYAALDDLVAVTTRADQALVKALARGFLYQRMLDEGRYGSISEMAAAERLERGYLGTLPRLTLLAPDLIETILDGWQMRGITLPRVSGQTSILWAAQKDLLCAAKVSGQPAKD